MVQNEKTKRRIFRLETYSSGRRIKKAYYTNEFYLSEDEVVQLACGMCIGLLSKYKHPVIKIYDDEAEEYERKLFDVVTISSHNCL